MYEKLDTEELLDTRSKTEEKMLENPNKQQTTVTEAMLGYNSGSSTYLPRKPVIKKKTKRETPRKNFLLKSSSLRRSRPSSKKVRSKHATETDSGSAGPIRSKNPQHLCIICNMKFGNSGNLTRHMLCHLEEKLFGCEVCNKRFSRKDNLRNHMKKAHSQGYECKICREPFNSYNTLADHLTSKHNIKEKFYSNIKYRCSECFKSFTSEKSKTTHMMDHVYNKNVQCHICKKSFISKANLTEHVKLHSEHSMKFLCFVCGERFILTQDLVIHMQQHSNPKDFSKNADRTIHSCSICNKGFRRISNLKAHIKTHTGEKPYCQAAFPQENDLNAHIQHHSRKRFTSK